MAIRQTVAPTIEPVSLDEVKLHLRLDSGSSEDTLLSSLIATARQYCEQYQRRAYITQTWELWLDRFPTVPVIDIPLPPLQSIISIKYYDTANSEYTLAASEYFADIKSQPGRISLHYGKTWPSLTLRPSNAVCITFVCGYGATAASVLERIRQAILLTIGHLYENREAVSNVQAYVVPMTVDSLLWQDRCF